jgi:hypothetical protein
MTIPGFKQDVQTFLQSKTNWTALGIIGGAVVGFYTKSVTPVEAFAGITNGLGMLFIRDAIAGQP